MHSSRLTSMTLAGSAAVILLAIVSTIVAPPSAHGFNLTDCTEWIVNGGFEQGDAGWQQQASPPLPPGAMLVDAFFPHTGALGAYLAGRNGASDRLSQTLALPAGLTSGTLTFWWALSTQEDAGAFDFMKIELYNASGGALITTLLTVDNTSASDWIWTPETFDLTSYAGQTVTLRFTATNDATGSPTAFFADDVSLSLCSSAPSPTPTRTLTPWPTATASPGATLSRTPTVTASATPSPSATTSRTPTLTPTGVSATTPTVTPKRPRALYLPLVIRATG